MNTVDPTTPSRSLDDQLGVAWLDWLAHKTDALDRFCTNDLFRYGASPLYPGAVIALPTQGSDKRCWLHPPTGEHRASFAAVVGLVETAATQASSR